MGIAVDPSEALATTVVTYRARLGTGALRSDAERPAVIYPGNAATARAEFYNIERRNN